MATAQIDLQALRSNYQYLKNLSPESQTLAVIKADAYGHGLVAVAQSLENVADGLAVARLEEALVLRDAGIQNSILLLDGFLSEKELQSALNHQFKVVLHDLSQIQLLESLGQDSKQMLLCWIKVNTGMNRLGLSLGQLASVMERLEKLSWVQCETLMTHLANADSGKNEDIAQPLKRFNEAKNICSNINQFSIANSAALIANKATHSSWNRPGISLYGCSTLDKKPEGLLPVMTLSAPVIAIHEVKKGESVGYGSIWTAEENTNIAVLGIGYGDGYPRHAKNGTPVYISGKEYPLSGRVSMDMITVNLGSNKEGIVVGDQAVLWGKTDESVLSADLIADYASTISYELFCKVTNRVNKEYLGG